MEQPKSKNAIRVIDFEFVSDDCGKKKELIEWLKQHAKKWSFQFGADEATRKYYKGRFSLNTKQRIQELNSPFHWELTPTPPTSQNNMFYVIDQFAPLAGPWTDTDKARYIPKQIRNISVLYPWQESVRDSVHAWDTRTINLLHCPGGNVGKSTLVGYLRAHGLARCLPPVNDYKDMMRMVCDLPTSRCYCVDMPRCMNKDKLYGFYSAVETLKDGYSFDDRYSFKEKIFDCPNIWIFTNSLPEEKLFSRDRWKLWQVDNQRKLMPCEFPK